MSDSTLTAKAQTTVPKDVREALGVKPGDTLSWRVRGNRATVRAKNQPIASIFGMLHDPKRKPLSLEDIDAAIARGAIKSAAGE
jgi:AbrB family looped-hinge helix DNA binding protein